MKRIAVLVIGIALMLPSLALGSGSSTCQSYNPQLCSVSKAHPKRMVGATVGGTSPSSASTLPFTGLDVILLAAGGGALLGAGLVVRRLSRDAG